MDNQWTRRSLLLTAPAAGALWWLGAASGPSHADDAYSPADDPATLHPNFPAHDPTRVREIVAVSHGNLDRVRELLAEQPELAKAAWDWGFGDWETALGAAAHTGRREIAELLIENGARPDVFAAAMLGNLAAVRGFLEADPLLLNAWGPHGIPLVKHAEFGGEPAEGVLDYLRSLPGLGEGAQEHLETARPLADHVGEYAWGEGVDERFRVFERDGLLAFQRGEAASRFLFHRGGGTFHPAGAPSAKVEFSFGDGGVTVTITDGPARLVAR